MIPRMSGGGGLGSNLEKHNVADAFGNLRPGEYTMGVDNVEYKEDVRSQGSDEGVTSVFTGFASCTFGHL